PSGGGHGASTPSLARVAAPVAGVAAPVGSACASRGWAFHLQEGPRALEAGSLEGRPVHQLGQDLRSIQQAIDRLNTEFARRLAGFERGGGPAAERAPSTVSWLTRECRMSAP